jgi:hypothetical protein
VLYHIRTLSASQQPSLIVNAELPDDLAAIVEARRLPRGGETIEVWRSELLIFSTGENATSFEKLRDVMSGTNSQAGPRVRQRRTSVAAIA